MVEARTVSPEAVLLNGRLRIRWREGAPRQFVRGVVGVAALLVPPAVGYVLFLAYAYGGLGAVVAGASSDGPGLPVLTGVPVCVFALGVGGYLVRWRRDYEVTVSAPEDMIGWD